jgi:hypothetical protein
MDCCGAGVSTSTSSACIGFTASGAWHRMRKLEGRLGGGRVQAQADAMGDLRADLRGVGCGGGAWRWADAAWHAEAGGALRDRHRGRVRRTSCATPGRAGSGLQ